MNAIHPTAPHIEKLIAFFVPHCADQTTLTELRDMVSDREQWRNAHALFCRIRTKTLRADDNNNLCLQHQYCFEEICAKTLYNMSGVVEPVPIGVPAPFDEDSPYCVGPIALGFAEYLELDVPDCVLSLIPTDS